jgi:CheY-like chemotaxis protein
VSKHKLLLADDSITIQKVVNLTFADEGIEVITVGDGNSAMEKFEEFTPDLVMADINMPGLSGYEICERIKGNEQTKRIPVILLVGSFEPFDEQEARRVGANDYLTKPFQSIRQLVTKVSGLLNATADTDETREEIQPPSSFDDTLGMDKAEISHSEQLGDAGDDDEMIQSYQFGSSASFDETPRFESQTEPEEYGKTQPLSADDLDEITSNQSQSPTDLSEQMRYGFTGESENREQESSVEETSEVENKTKEFAFENESYNQTEESEPSQSASVLELDETNLLELPPRANFAPSISATSSFEDDFQTSNESMDSVIEETTAPPYQTEEAIEPEPTEEPYETVQPEPIDKTEEIVQPEAVEESGETTEPESFEETSKPTESAQTINLSPEVIDQIAEKVAEKVVRMLADRKLKE